MAELTDLDWQEGIPGWTIDISISMVQPGIPSCPSQHPHFG